MDVYRIFYREVLRMRDPALLADPWATRIVILADIREGSAPGEFGADTGGIFAKVTDETEGFVYALTGVDAQDFPDTGSMTGREDAEGKTEERLLVNVSVAGPTGSTLNARDLSVPLDVVGVNISDWSAIGTGPIGWTASSPTAGSVSLGFVQRQTR